MESQSYHNPPARPPIDPELAALEAGAHQQHEHAAHAQGGLANTIKRMLMGAGRTDKGVPSAGPQGTPASPGREARWKRRAMARLGTDPDPRGQPHARLGRMKARQPDWMREAEARREMERFLRKLKISQCVQECQELKLVAHLGSVLALANSSDASIRVVSGLGPARRRKIHEYLTSKGVPVVWKP